MEVCKRCEKNERNPENRLGWCDSCEQWRKDKINGFLNPGFKAMTSALPADDVEFVEERAAIREYDGGLGRAAAERAAVGDLVVDRDG